MGITAQYVHGARVCLIPSPYNDHRPYALRHKPLALVSALLIAAKVAVLTVVAITPTSAELSTITASRIVQLTNAERTQVGLSSLSVNSKLSSAAAQKAQHMLDEDYFAHISPSGVTPWFWMSKVGYAYTIAGENLAIDFVEAEDVVAAWLASPTHKENMLHKDYTETGVAVATGEFEGGTSTVVVHMFGNPVGSQVAAETTTSPTPTPTTTPAPSPTATPTPVPTQTVTPVPSPSDTAPPRTPRIALIGSTAEVGEAVTVTITGEPGALTYVLVNSQSRQEVTLPEGGVAELDVPLSSFPDGSLVLRAFSEDAEGNQSTLSEALALVKDTVGPSVASEQLAFMISPGFDRLEAALRVSGEDFTSLELIGASEHVLAESPEWIYFAVPSNPVELYLRDSVGNQTDAGRISLLPDFFQETLDQSSAKVPAQLNQFVRRLAIGIMAAILVLLILAVLIRIRVQQPGLITHASFVVLLAAILFLF